MLDSAFPYSEALIGQCSNYLRFLANASLTRSDRHVLAGDCPIAGILEDQEMKSAMSNASRNAHAASENTTDHPVSSSI